MPVARKKIVIVASILIVLAAGLATWAALKTKLELSDTTDTVVAVGRHYLLPDEEPAIATVEDKEKVQSEFFRAAENGDKLLIYKEAKKVILYRPSIDRIVEVGPVSIAPAANAGQ